MCAAKKAPSTIFEENDYRHYLGARLEELGHGARSRLATAIQVHTAYVTQVLSGKSQLSLEQADRCSAFLGHSEEEAHCFLLLVSLDRAGSSSLKNHFKRELAKLRQSHSELSQRLSFEKTLNVEEQLRYYESWMPSAIHIALTIPELRSLDALTSRFRVSSERVLKALNTLLALGLAEKKGTLYFPLSKTLHAGRGSATLRQHHSNWRLNAVESLDRESAEELHYTSVVSLARDDVVRIRETLVRAIEDVRNVVKPSQEEDLYCYTLDLFRVE
jgi:uncharacterized protein (TIGR02147 family)